ncbi:MAG: 50S ribosomal protein L24 [Planctomycetaceae bacterium]|jgi:large subunit ribosomal protein L24|nr:50S ribosomal protein L24 [Planctomycetaceae bacterium]
MRVCKGDMVQVISGGDRGLRARVVSVDREKSTVTVSGVNIVKKLVRRSRRNPQGGVLSKEMPMSACKVMVVCPSCQRATRVGAKVEADGSKFRTCRKCGATISQISPAKKK